jgi:hypothetical protein
MWTGAVGCEVLRVADFAAAAPPAVAPGAAQPEVDEGGAIATDLVVDAGAAAAVDGVEDDQWPLDPVGLGVASHPMSVPSVTVINRTGIGAERIMKCLKTGLPRASARSARVARRSSRTLIGRTGKRPTHQPDSATQPRLRGHSSAVIGALIAVVELKS